VNRRSIRFQLTACYAGILALTMAAAGAGTWLAIRQSIHATVDKDLRSRVRTMREYLANKVVEEGVQKLATELEDDAAIVPAGAHYRVADERGSWIYQSPGTRGWPAQAFGGNLPTRGATRTVTVANQPLRMLSAPVAIGVRPWTLELGTPLGEFYNMLDEFVWTALFAAPVALLVASAGGYWMSRRVLQPVDRITRASQAIGAHNLSERLPLRGAGDELDRLSATLNSMFARLDDTFRRITQFTADASHELRTPVAVIRTSAELALNRPRSEGEYVKALERILGESERTSRLIEHLLTLARADAGSGGFEIAPMDLADAARAACAEARVLAEARQLSLSEELSCACPVAGDYQALRRLLLILLDNAVKYTAAGGRIRVCVHLEDGSAMAEIRDTGIGIGPEDLPHIFDRFYRAAKDRPRENGGAGLGLSIAQWIVRGHGGEISVESTPGAGSVFRVRLPLSSPNLQDTLA
jgi:heavy metal sensor kinase